MTWKEEKYIEKKKRQKEKMINMIYNVVEKVKEDREKNGMKVKYNRV